MPITPGSAKGLRRSPWRPAPARPRLIPTETPRIALGTLSSRKISFSSPVYVTEFWITKLTASSILSLTEKVGDVGKKEAKPNKKKQTKARIAIKGF